MKNKLKNFTKNSTVRVLNKKQAIKVTGGGPDQVVIAFAKKDDDKLGD